MWLAEWQAGLAEFFDDGGHLLWIILGLSILMWALIAERYWFYARELGPTLARVLSEWRQTAVSGVTATPRLRALEQRVREFRSVCTRRLEVIRTLTGVLPLVGLLGTVSGMIKVFQVITVFGTGNTRGMAAGIAEALLTTMAGLLTALSGLYFVSNLENRAERSERALRSSMIEEMVSK
jgi:biopolymer transport protein ExbB